MLKDNLFKITITSRNKNFYLELGYTSMSIGQEILVPINHISIGSHKIICVICDYCSKEYNSAAKSYFKYKLKNPLLKKDACFDCRYLKMKDCCQAKNGVDNVFQLKEIKNKIKITNLEKYGVDNPAKNDDVKRKYAAGISSSSANALIRRKATNIEKYGVDNVAKVGSIKESWMQTKKDIYGDKNYNNSTKMLETKVSLGLIIPDYELAEYDSYCRNVLRITQRNVKKLYNSWGGYDYYDNEFILENLQLSGYDRNYPTVDHKISIYQGFITKMPYEEIGSIENLCITKRYINSSKNHKTEGQYKNWLKNLNNEKRRNT